MRKHGFTLLELLVVVAIVAVLIAVLVPSLSTAKNTAKRTRCLTQMRSLEQAHWIYMSENEGHFIEVTHGAIADSWITKLSKYYGGPLMNKSPVDMSPHWPTQLGGAGTPVMPSGRLRYSSYGVSNYTSGSGSVSVKRLQKVERPFTTVHFVMMTTEGANAASDHVHANSWYNASDPLTTVANAAAELAMNAHGGPVFSEKGRSNYGFVDGHAETLTFAEVYSSPTRNWFDPAVAY